ncbi:MAG: hypothetical protein R2822_27195 [Spirosomataceae bacterium]
MPKSPPPAPPKVPPVAATPPPPPAPAVVKAKLKRDHSKLMGGLAIGAVAVGSVGFISWSMFQEDEIPAIAPIAAPAIEPQPIIPELVKEEIVETPPPTVEMIPPPVPKPIARAPKPMPKPEPEATPLASPVLPVEIKVVDVSDDTEFKEAFLEARDQVGPGGLFEYKGQWYSTFSIEEWNKMPAEMRDEFTTRIDPIVNPLEAEAPVAVVEEEPIVVHLDSNNDGIDDTIMSDQNHDGLADIVIKDEPGEGISGYMYVDKDHDGKLETAIPVSDEGQVMEDLSETLKTPIEIPMQPANAVAGIGELAEVVDLDIEGATTLETATPIHHSEAEIMAQVEVFVPAHNPLNFDPKRKK